MNELTNIVKVTGTYDSVPISLTSNTSVVKLVDGLTLTLEADKNYWKDGNLKYTITLNNATDVNYENVKLTDVLDTTYISFVEDSVKINDIEATSSEYEYNDGTNTLTINLASVDAQNKTTITFSVKKSK